MKLFYTSPGGESDEDKDEEKDSKDSFEDLQEDEFEDGLGADDYGDGDTDNSWPSSGKGDSDEEEAE